MLKLFPATVSLLRTRSLRLSTENDTLERIVVSQSVPVDSPIGKPLSAVVFSVRVFLFLSNLCRPLVGFKKIYK